MPIIGKPLQTGGYHVLDSLSASATANYTLQLSSANFIPESANHLIVSLNGVIQKPGSSFTVSGAVLSFSSSLTSSDSIDFVIALGNTMDIGTPSSGTVGATQLKADLISGTTALTSEPASSDELLLSDAGTLKRIDYSLITNTPAFEAYRGSNQGISDNTATKVQFDTEVFDTGTVYDNSSNYRFTPGLAGKYFCYSTIRGGNDGTGTLNLLSIKFYKNGSAHQTGTTQLIHYIDNPGANASVTITQIIDLDDDDYVEIYATIDTTTGSPDVGQNSVFGAFKLTGV
jgi:hypothetical protein